MATATIFTLLVIIATATITVSARPGIPFHPCNTLIISTFSFSLNSNNPDHPNPNPNFVIMDLRPIRFPRRFSHHFLADKSPVSRFSQFPDLPLGFRDRLGPRRPQLTLGFDDRRRVVTSRPSEMTDLPFGFSSMRDRTKDILSVVASLLFGAACGALTAGTMYLIWSILNFRHGSDYSSVEGFSSDDDDDNDDIFNPKKSHYVVIPSSADPIKEKVVDSAPVAAKENA